MKGDELTTGEELIHELLELRRKNLQLETAIADLSASHQEWKETFDSISDAITVHDRNFTVLHANRSAGEIFGLPSEKMIGSTCYQLNHGTDSPPQDCPCYQLFRTGAAASMEKFEPKLNKYIEIKVFPHLKGSEVVRVIHVVRDITDRKQMENSLKESEEKFRSMVETTDDSIYIVDRDCRYLYINKKHQGRLGITDDTYIGRTYGDYHTVEQTQWFAEKVQRALRSGSAFQYEHLSTRDNNHFLLTLSPVRSGNGEIIAVSTISKNITEFKRIQDKLRVMCITDDLTGLYNRRGFFSLSEHQLKIAGRMRKGLFLFYADIDNLKQVNDRFGHIEGDQLIIRTADILKESFRDSDIIARIGGDEFVIFPVEGEGGASDAVMERLQRNIDRINEDSALKYPISISIGKAYYDPAEPCSIEDLLSRADSSMYESKINKDRTKRLSS